MNEFDKFAKNYDNDLDNILNSSIGTSSDYFAKYKIKELYAFMKNKKQPKNILDFGCGVGKNSVLMKDYFSNSNIFGIDISEDSINIAKEKELDGCLFSTYSGENIDFKNDFFDIIFISNVFHHIEHKYHIDILNMLKDKLSPNGYIFLFEHNTLNPLTLKIVNECEFDKDAKLLHFWYTKKLFKNLGFNTITKFILFVPPLLKKLLFIEKYLKRLPLGGAVLYNRKKVNFNVN